VNPQNPNINDCVHLVRQFIYIYQIFYHSKLKEIIHFNFNIIIDNNNIRLIYVKLN